MVKIAKGNLSEKNYDENLLLRQRVDSALSTPVMEQVLRIAVYDELHALSFYSGVVERFGSILPFSNIIEAEKRHYELLLPLLERYQVDVPINSWHNYISIPDTVVECCEVGIASEIDNISLYNHLLTYVEDNAVREVFYRLQAASHNKHLPAFRKCVVNYRDSADDPNIQDIYKKHGQHNLDDIFEKVEKYRPIIDSLIEGKVNQEAIGKILQESNLAIIGGALLGGLAIMTMANMKEDN